MNRLTRILSATLGLMGFGAGVRESIENPAPEPDSIRLEQRTEPVDPGHDIEPDGRPAASDTIRVTMGDMVVGRPDTTGLAEAA